MSVARRNYFYLLLSFLPLLSACGSRPNLLPITENPSPNKAYYSELLTFVENEVEKTPDDLQLRIKLAGYHQILSWPSEADANVEVILQMAPKDPQVMVLVADYYIHRNDFEKSWIYAQQADRLGSVHPSLSLIKAKYFHSQRNFGEASRYLNHYFETGGKLSEAFLVAAELELQAADIATALATLQSGIEANPGHLKMTSLLSELLAGRNEFRQLVSILENYSTLTGDQLTFRDMLLSGYFAAGDYKAASDLARSWPEPDENGIFEYGNLLLESSMPDSANWYADQLLASDSLSVEGRLLKGRYFDSRGRLGDAYNFYTAALALDSTNQIAREERGIVAGKIAYLRKIRQEQAAMPVFDIAPKKSDNQ